MLLVDFMKRKEKCGEIKRKKYREMRKTNKAVRKIVRKKHHEDVRDKHGLLHGTDNQMLHMQKKLESPGKFTRLH